ncbi:OmpA family protein [Spectribacter hydrogenoxidans]|uniref:OmpA family protein n=1 Tax=Spectribacter hydrogenoxidans TaxID=3075608 RepID=A0ABU3C2S9_9GAMM|nr:OmpA family protein [Salinisphaera sp. W335]MDT0635840.1 OmpA family protein [Salinisphaera sp. W335]
MRLTFATGPALLAALAFGVSATAGAQNEDNTVDKRFYIAPMYSFGDFDDASFNNGNEVDFDETDGYTIAIGKTLSKMFALEVFASGFSGVEDLNSNGEADIDAYGVSGLIFPYRDFFPFFLLGGAGTGDYEFGGMVGGMAADDGDGNFYEFGGGVLLPVPDLLDFGYGVSLRAEYRVRSIDVEISGTDDLSFTDKIASVGLSIPLGAPPAEPEPEPAPTPAPPPPPPADSDDDGVNDDNDECPGTPVGTEVDATGCPIEKDEPIVLKGVTFEFNSDRLTADAENRLDNVVNALMGAEDIDVRVEGHTDSIGDEAYNQNLSQDRADSVKRYLVEHGIEPGRLTTEGFGESKPVASNETDAGRAENRRVELHVAD